MPRPRLVSAVRERAAAAVLAGGARKAGRVSVVDVDRQARELGRLRAGIINAAEALEDGDSAYALAVLRALDETPARTIGCPRCYLRFRWPGELDHHLRFGHLRYASSELEEAADAA